MPQDFTSTGLVAAIRRNAALGPDVANSFPRNSDLLAWLNEELTNTISTMLMKPREERFVEYFETVTESAETEYRIPYGSLYDDVRDVQVYVGQQWQSLPYSEPELLSLFSYPAPTTANQVSAYYFRSNYVVLFPPPVADIPLRIKYFRRPSFVVESGYATPTAAAGSGPTYTATVVTTGMATGSFDLLSSTFPYDVILLDLAGTVTNGTTLTLTLTAAQYATLTDSLNASYLIAAGDAPGPQISQDFISLLEQRTTLRALVGKKDIDGAKVQSSLCEQTQRRLVESMSPREDGLGRKVVGRSFAGRGRFPWGSATRSS